jgi:hypothetical protein
MENTASKTLYDLLVTRDLEPEILNSAGKPVSDPSEAELFSFDWSVDDKNYGTVVVLLGDDGELEVYYGDNLGRTMEPDHKKSWYDFLAQLKNFATRNLLKFELNNINRLKYTMQGMAAIKEGLFEGYYGKRNISYSDQPKQTRLMIKHSRNLGEGEARYRAIESLYVETADGERFRVPSRSLMHGRMLARHIAEGGTPYDALGQHINSVVTELATLSRFLRASRGRDLGEDAAALVDEATRHYHNLRSKARKMIAQRGYSEARDQFDPAATHAVEQTVESIRDLFVEQRLDSRIEEALPILAKLQDTTMKEADEFESWINQVSEGTWALPNEPVEIKQMQELLANPLPVGPDATNAIEQLYNIFGDDVLFDQLGDLAQRDAEADARELIQARLAELGVEISQEQNRPNEMDEDLDTDGVMMTRPSNMSSESRQPDALKRIVELISKK